ncbi:hypothetical protein U14_03971 [Candidatus Moduliflexus flocculans]|uniref:Uncharacterized protein n=1 Tax=Candidatus Moduliflexus flocculans TaxID=1499966 RepID=A0A0S6W365_9BACT|nr:hypothetical protein U14_03971 [Candidatus Moduliflexus flocculans]
MRIQKINAALLKSCLFTLLGFCIVTMPMERAYSDDSASADLNGIIPDSLTALEEQAEDIIDVVPAAKWATVNADIANIDNSWAHYHPQAEQDQVSQTTQQMFLEALSRLKSLAAEQDALGTMQTANDLSAAVIEMFDVYHPAIPTGIGRLDVLERQIILDVTTQKFTVAHETLTKIQTVWEQVKPSISEHNGQSSIEQFTASLTFQAQALQEKDVEKLKKEAQNGLEIVDLFEKLYE